MSTVDFEKIALHPRARDVAREVTNERWYQVMLHSGDRVYQRLAAHLAVYTIRAELLGPRIRKRYVPQKKVYTDKEREERRLHMQMKNREKKQRYKARIQEEKRKYYASLLRWSEDGG